MAQKIILQRENDLKEVSARAAAVAAAANFFPLIIAINVTPEAQNLAGVAAASR